MELISRRDLVCPGRFQRRRCVERNECTPVLSQSSYRKSEDLFFCQELLHKERERKKERSSLGGTHLCGIFAAKRRLCWYQHFLFLEM